MTRTWVFKQNNSFGQLVGAGAIVVLAPSMLSAVRTAKKQGVYFRGVDRGVDCPCCGDRWRAPEEATGDEVAEMCKYEDHVAVIYAAADAAAANTAYLLAMQISSTSKRESSRVDVVADRKVAR